MPTPNATGSQDGSVAHAVSQRATALLAHVSRARVYRIRGTVPMTTLPRTEMTVALSVAAFGAYELARAYRDMVPNLDELRNTDNDDYVMNCNLRDADVLLGGLALIAGATATILARSAVPALVVLTGYVWVAGFHHYVAAAPAVRMMAPDDYQDGV